jgi:hypothetical protein
MILRREKSTFNEFRTVAVSDLGKIREEVDWIQLSSRRDFVKLHAAEFKQRGQAHSEAMVRFRSELCKHVS